MASMERYCPVCGKILEPGASPVVCVACHTVYHAECWDTLSNCMAFGCRRPTNEQDAKLDASKRLMTCPSCRKEVPAASQRCLECGAELGKPLPKRSRFYSCGGWTAESPEELVAALGLHWESGVQHLYLGDLEYWFAQEGRQDLADKAKAARLANAQKSVGLEAFLQSTGLVDKPVLELSTHTLVMESSNTVIESVIDVRNSGRGYLSGKVSVDADWIEVDCQEFVGNRTRVQVTVNTEKLSSASSVGHVRFASVGGDDSVEIRAKRIGIDEAVALFRSSNFSQARAVCRRLLDARTAGADAVVLTAACCLEEDDAVNAVAALRRLSGGCQRLPSDIAQLVYEWLKEGDSVAAGLNLLGLYETLMPCIADGERDRVKKDVARLALDLARSSSDSVGSSGTSLWRSGSDASADIRGLLQLAETYDPSLAAEVREARRGLSGRIRKGMLVTFVWTIVVVLVLAAGSAGAWYLYSNDTTSVTTHAEELMAKDDFKGALREMRMVYSNQPDDAGVRAAYCKALIGSAKEAFSRCDQVACEAYVSQALNAVSGNSAASAELGRLLLEWAQILEHSANYGEARIRIEQALTIDPGDQESLLCRTRVATTTEGYYALYKLSQSSVGQRAVMGFATSPSYQQGATLLRNMGVELYDGRMMLAFADVLGTGHRDLIVAGTTGDEGKEVGQYAVYQLNGSTLKKLFSGRSVEYPIVSGVSVFNLSGNDRNDGAITWGARDLTAGKYQTLLLAYSQAKFVTETIDGDTQPVFTDRSADGRYEIWLSQLVAESTGPADRVYVAHPFVWNEPGVVAAPGDFSEYYRGYIALLKEQIAKNPYVEEDPRAVLFAGDRQKAIIEVEKVLSQSRSGAAQ